MATLASSRGHFLRTRARNWLRLQRSRLPGYQPPPLDWLFVATLPNSGSTALARLLETSPAVTTLESKAEGQWLLPQLSRGSLRWDAHLELDYALVRAVWLDYAAKRSSGPGLLVEKSPPNMVRMRPLVHAFADLNPKVLIFTREPLAVCASWAKRYTSERILRMWLPPGTPPIDDEEAFYRTLGRLCGQRMSVLSELRDMASMILSYEELTDSPESTLQRLKALSPHLEGIDSTERLHGVKDYEPQQLRNMNAEQISTLSAEQRVWVREALAPFAPTLSDFGYVD